MIKEKDIVYVLKSAILSLIEKTKEYIIEETGRRVITNDGYYYIDEGRNQFVVVHENKNGDSYPLMFVAQDDGIFSFYAWDECGWKMVLQPTDLTRVESTILNSYYEHEEHKDEYIYDKVEIPFESIGLLTKQTYLPNALALNNEIKGMLDKEVVPNPNAQPEITMRNLTHEYMFEKYFVNWRKTRLSVFEDKWGGVYNELQIPVFYRTKHSQSTVKVKKHGLFKTRLIITTKVPFTYIKDEHNEDILVEEVSKVEELESKLGPDFDLEACKLALKKKKQYTCSSRFDDYYFRIAKNLVFSCDTVEMNNWKYEGILMPEQESQYEKLS